MGVRIGPTLKARVYLDHLCGAFTSTGFGCRAAPGYFLWSEDAVPYHCLSVQRADVVSSVHTDIVLLKHSQQLVEEL